MQFDRGNGSVVVLCCFDEVVHQNDRIGEIEHLMFPQFSVSSTLADIDKGQLGTVLTNCGDNIAVTARMPGVGWSALDSRLKNLGIQQLKRRSVL